jgi:hypothetical protein
MAARRRKATRRRSPRRRALGTIPVYPPVLGITGMPLTFATIGPLAGLGSPQSEHIDLELQAQKQAKHFFRETKHHAMQGHCERALDNFAVAMAFAGHRKAHESAGKRYSGLVKAEMDTDIENSKHVISRCFVSKR